MCTQDMQRVAIESVQQGVGGHPGDWEIHHFNKYISQTVTSLFRL